MDHDDGQELVPLMPRLRVKQRGAVVAISAEINAKGELILRSPGDVIHVVGKVVGRDGRDGVDGEPGQQGTPGIRGVAGRDGLDGPGFVWRGGYAAGTIYYGQNDNPDGPYADVVEYQGSAYICTGRTLIAPPGGTWELMVQGVSGQLPSMLYVAGNGGGGGGGGTGEGPDPGIILPRDPGATAQVGTSLRYAREDHRHKEQDVPAPATAVSPVAGVGAVGTSTKFAREDHVHPAQAVPSPSTTTPLSPGTAAPGTATEYARADHRHPLQAVPAASDQTPLIAAGSGAAGVLGDFARADHVHPAQAVPTASTTPALPPGTAAAGTSAKFAREDHVHPSQAVPVASNAAPLAPTSVGGPGTSADFARSDHRHPEQDLSGLQSQITAAQGDATAAQSTASSALTIANAAMPKTGGTFSGQISVPNGTSPGHAVNKSQLDAVSSGGATPGTALPLPEGIASAGVATAYSREDHVHPAQNLSGYVKADGSVAFTAAQTGVNGTASSHLVTKAQLDLKQDVILADAVLAPGSIARTIPDKFGETVSVLDFATAAQRSDIRAYTGLVDVVDAVNRAQDALTSVGGGTLWYPPGRYRLSTAILCQNNIRHIGASRRATILQNVAALATARLNDCFNIGAMSINVIDGFTGYDGTLSLDWRSITLTAGAGANFAVGEMAFLATTVTVPIASDTPAEQGFMVHISAKAGDVITFEAPLPETVATPRLYKFSGTDGSTTYPWHVGHHIEIGNFTFAQGSVHCQGAYGCYIHDLVIEACRNFIAWNTVTHSITERIIATYWNRACEVKLFSSESLFKDIWAYWYDGTGGATPTGPVSIGEMSQRLRFDNFNLITNQTASLVTYLGIQYSRILDFVDCNFFFGAPPAVNIIDLLDGLSAKTVVEFVNFVNCEVRLGNSTATRYLRTSDATPANVPRFVNFTRCRFYGTVATPTSAVNLQGGDNIKLIDTTLESGSVTIAAACTNSFAGPSSLLALPAPTIGTLTNANATLTWLLSAPKQLLSVALTANRTLTLSATNAVVGAVFKITRAATSTGAFTLSVGGLILLDPGGWCEVSYDGTAWVLTESGLVAGAVGSLTGQIETVQNKTYVLDIKASRPYTITSLTRQSVSGSCTAAIQIDGVNVTGLSGLTINTTETETNATAANSVAVGQTVSLVVTGNSTCLDLMFALKVAG